MTATEKTTYAVIRYDNGWQIGKSELTREQFRHCESMARDGGLIRLGALPHDYYDLDPEHQDAHEDTIVCLV